VTALARQLRTCGMGGDAIGRVFATFYAAAPAFLEQHQREQHQAEQHRGQEPS
jgi:hypothetical protein